MLRRTHPSHQSPRWSGGSDAPAQETVRRTADGQDTLPSRRGILGPCPSWPCACLMNGSSTRCPRNGDVQAAGLTKANPDENSHDEKSDQDPVDGQRARHVAFHGCQLSSSCWFEPQPGWSRIGQVSSAAAKRPCPALTFTVRSPAAWGPRLCPADAARCRTPLEQSADKVDGSASWASRIWRTQ